MADINAILAGARAALDSLHAARAAYFREGMSEFVRATGHCEDYPCCGHTDGLGCAWVSPNARSPFDADIIVAEARVVQAEREARGTHIGFCEGCEDEADCVGEAHEGDCTECICEDCEMYAEYEREQYAREMQEQYDGTWY